MDFLAKQAEMQENGESSAYKCIFDNLLSSINTSNTKVNVENTHICMYKTQKFGIKFLKKVLTFSSRYNNIYCNRSRHASE